MFSMQKKSGIGISLAVAALACSIAAKAQQQAPPPITVKPLNGDVYWATGGAGANSGIIVGKDGVIVVDAKMTVPSAKELLADIGKTTPSPVTTVILTHSDGDHVNGLAGFPDGLTIIAQQNCKNEMEESVNTKQPAPQNRLPNKTVDKKADLTIDGVKMTLLHFAPAHTSGDLMIYLPAQKIVFTGDIIATNGPLTLIHLEKHGSSEGWIETVKGLIKLNADTYVPGHGVLQTKADLQARLERVETQRDKIKKMVAEGKTLDQIKEELGEKDMPAAPGAPQFASFTTVVYQELTKKG